MRRIREERRRMRRRRGEKELSKFFILNLDVDLSAFDDDDDNAGNTNATTKSIKSFNHNTNDDIEDVCYNLLTLSFFSHLLLLHSPLHFPDSNFFPLPHSSGENAR